jgi:hypothetical protein
MDLVTSITVITLGTAAIGSFVSLFKYVKQPNDPAWKLDVESLRKEIELNKNKTLERISELETKITVLGLDSNKIEEIKSWILRLEGSIETENTKLESKIDNLLSLIIEMMGKGPRK